jgi:hypothetical protein
MAVTENDVIQNAAAIASLINEGSDNVNIADLDAVGSLNDADLFHVSVSGVDKKITKANAITGGGGSTEHNPVYPAGSFDYPASNPAPLDTDSGTNGTIKRQLFDDTTEEFVTGQFKVPSDIDPSGTVTFRSIGYAVTADGNEIQLRFGHSAKASGESWDGAFTDEDSGDKSTDADQDELDIFTWTETVSNLGWSAGDLCRFQLSRIAIDDGTPVSGDYGIVYFEIDIPRS